MARTSTCDVCGRELSEDNPKVAKMFISHTDRGKIRHNEYSSHMDIGSCCLVKISNLGNWQRRKSQPQKSPKKKHMPKEERLPEGEYEGERQKPVKRSTEAA